MKGPLLYISILFFACACVLAAMIDIAPSLPPVQPVGPLSFVALTVAALFLGAVIVKAKR